MKVCILCSWPSTCLVVNLIITICNPPGSAPSHRAGLELGMPAWEAGALPRRLKATVSSVSR